MVSQKLLVTLLAAYVSAVPLNINLGAYSPALVVGDGSIEFGGSPERASQVLQTLATGAENGAVPAGQTTPGQQGAQANGGTAPAPAAVSVAPAVSASALPAVVSAPAPAASGPGISSPLVSGNEAANPQNTAFDPSNPVPAEYISHKFDGPISPVTKYPNMVKEKKIVSKRSEPAAAEAEKRSEPYTVKANFKVTERMASPEPESEIARRIKRDIDGFREALAFARDGQKNQPKVILDAGITVFPGSAIPINSAANGALPPATGAGAAPAKRAIAADTKADDKLGMTLIAIGEI